MDPFDSPLQYSSDEQAPPNPALSAFKRAIWIIITLLVILSLITSLLVPIFLSNREPRRNPENEIQAHWMSNQYSETSVQSITNYELPLSTT